MRAETTTKVLSKTGSPRALAAWVVCAATLLTLASGSDPAEAQLGIPGFSLIPGFDAGMLGTASAVGDFNNDGYDDLVVGMPEFDVAGNFAAGAVGLFLGGDGDWSNVFFFVSEDLLIPGESGARFGSALTTGDFDQDGHDDLVIGVPGKSVNGVDSAGEIVVAYGTSSGSKQAAAPDGSGVPAFDIARTQVFSQAPLPGAVEEDDQFGFSLAAGDLSADGVADLAIGIPFEDIDSKLGLLESVGAINIMYGISGVGLTAAGSQLFNEDSPGIGFNANTDERFGFSLAIGHFAGSGVGFTDLAVGVPGEVVFGPGMHGGIVIFPGAPSGIDPTTSTVVTFSQHTPGVLGVEQDGDEFGYALAVGNFDGDSWTDLAIGVPGESEFGTTESGAVQILYGNVNGLIVGGNQFLVESTIDPDVSAFDRLGMAVAAGDFDGDGRDDLAMGAPLDNSLGFANSGEVTVFYGTPSGVSTAGHQIFNMIFFDTLEIGTLFGSALTTGRFFRSGEGRHDLAVGVPRFGTPVGSEPGASLVIRSQVLFEDGFETGNTSAWSSTVP